MNSGTVIQHNLAAMFSNRQLGVTGTNLAKSSEKLSSGYRINRAADDAAGLSISEKMRRQIRGLHQASLNAQDGISLVQVADGAMAEVNDMLHRMTELSVKAANGTLDASDRQAIQQEISQIKEEINAIQHKTTFNEIPVLKGGVTEEIVGGVRLSGTGLPAVASIDQASLDAGVMAGTYTNNGNTYAAFEVDLSGFDSDPAGSIRALDGTGFYTTCCTCDKHYSIEFSSGTQNSSSVSGNHFIYTIGIGGCASANDVINQIIAGTDNGHPNNHYTELVNDGNGKLIVHDNRTTAQAQPNKAAGYGLVGKGVASDPNDPKIKTSFQPDLILQVGAEHGDEMEIKLPNINASTLGVSGVDVTTEQGARSAISDIKAATHKLLRERARMGAYQNRLEHTVANLNNVVENTTAAESRIRDTDMAEEMVRNSNLNILQQAGQAMLAQANKSTEGVMQLLQ